MMSLGTGGTSRSYLPGTKRSQVYKRQWAQLVCRRFSLSTRRHFWAVHMAESWSSVSREIVSLLLRDIKKQHGNGLGYVVLGDPAWAGAGPDGCKGSSILNYSAILQVCPTGILVSKNGAGVGHHQGLMEGAVGCVVRLHPSPSDVGRPGLLYGANPEEKKHNIGWNLFCEPYTDHIKIPETGFAPGKTHGRNVSALAKLSLLITAWSGVQCAMGTLGCPCFGRHNREILSHHTRAAWDLIFFPFIPLCRGHLRANTRGILTHKAVSKGRMRRQTELFITILSMLKEPLPQQRLYYN